MGGVGRAGREGEAGGEVVHWGGRDGGWGGMGEGEERWKEMGGRRGGPVGE